MKERIAVCFGEVLWDVFPDESRIGGAPLNVASRLSHLGIETEIISKVGNDIRGQEIIAFLRKNNVHTGSITEDENLPTGVVNVTLSQGGSATYEITHPAAWDKIKVTEGNIKAVEESSAFVFGSLVCRDEVSREALFELLPKARFKILDINLRPPHYTGEVLNRLLREADLIKFNDEELFEISGILGSSYNSLEQNIRFVSERTEAKTICVTKGQHGAVLLHEGKWYYNSGYKTEVKDTVGAGDSFLATLIANLLKEEPVQFSLNHACAMGALVAGRKGANPSLSKEEVLRFMQPDYGL